RHRLRDHPQLLRPDRRRGVWTLRRVCAAAKGIRGRGCQRSDPLRYDPDWMKLGTLLLRNAAIGLSQLEAALRNQVLYGGRRGGNLVELGFIDVALLSSYLAELSGHPIATPSLLDNADRRLLDKLGGDDAHRLRAIPIGYLGEGTHTLAVAIVDPDAATI